MIDKDDDEWVTLLGGGNVPDAAARTRAEAERLRAVSADVRAARAEAREGDAFDADGVWSKVVEEGRRSGAFPTGEIPADIDLGLAPPPRVVDVVPRQRGSRRWAIWSGLGTAVIAFLWFGAQPMLLGTRGGAEHLPPIVRAHPKEDAARIAEELKAAGASAAVTVSSAPDDTKASIAVDTGSPARPGKAIDDVLARHGVAPPNGGQFVIEVRPALPARP